MAAAVGISRLRTTELPGWLTGPLVPSALAAVLGLIGLGDKSFWLDEAFSAFTARMGTLDLVGYLWRSELNASPYYLLLKPWSHLGTGEATLRLLSVIIGVIAVATTYYVGKRYNVGFQAALLLAVFPIFVEFEQTARVYTLLVAWASISTLAYLRYSESPGRLRALVYIATAALMIYVHPVGAFVIGAHVLWTVARTPRPLWLRPLALFVPVLVVWIPMLLFMRAHPDKISWIPPLSAGSVSDAFLGLAGGALAAVAISVVLGWLVLRSGRQIPLLPVLWLIVPIVGVLLVSAFVQPMLQARYLIVVLPALAIVLGRARPAVLALLALALLVGVAGWYVAPSQEDWRSATAWIHSAVQPGDGVVYSPSFADLPVRYYGEVGEVLRTAPPYSNPRIWLIERPDNLIGPVAVATLGPYDVADTRTYGPDGPHITLLVRR